MHLHHPAAFVLSTDRWHHPTLMLWHPSPSTALPPALDASADSQESQVSRGRNRKYLSSGSAASLFLWVLGMKWRRTGTCPPAPGPRALGGTSSAVLTHAWLTAGPPRSASSCLHASLFSLERFWAGVARSNTGSSVEFSSQIVTHSFRRGLGDSTWQFALPLGGCGDQIWGSCV